MTASSPDDSDRTVERKDGGGNGPDAATDQGTRSADAALHRPSRHPDRTDTRTAVAGTVSAPGVKAPGSSAVGTVPGYELTGEIARGGMGIVLAARDVTLNREVAIKTLLPGSAGERMIRRRFMTEAYLTAQLTHPGIPPVYALGELPDSRPYMAMKLVRGRTLAAILTAREQRPSSRSADDLSITTPDAPGLLLVFEQICQAVGFAHSQDIVHRDLKPANVMVGPFGEVQVMDWGLAKQVRPRDRRASVWDTSPGKPAPDEVSRPGEAMGTPAYMPPEQARGEWDRVDARADVFALGGILSMILTGKPPYTGAKPLAVLKRAEAADLAEAFARLDGCGADADLIALAKRCLAADPACRPRDAGAVVGLVQAHRLEVEERLPVVEAERAAAAARAEEARRRAAAAAAARRAAEERAKETTRRAEEELATEQRKGRRTQLALGAAVVVWLLTLGGAFAWRLLGAG